jgi:hypothetical protein
MRVATGVAALACTAGLSVLPLTRVGESGRTAALLTALVAIGVLAVALVSGWSRLVPLALLLVGAVYAAQLAVDDMPLDVAAPLFAAGLLVAAELAYWSLDEREAVRGERGDALRSLGRVAALGVAASVLAAALLATADGVRARGLGVDVAGAAAAALALLVIVFATRRRPGED